MANKKQKDWQIQEKVVAIIEKYLDESATVEHDVHLPVLNSPSKAKRQCDVVITQGLAPRQTVSIVEIQKKNKKVEINEFNGWLKKCEDVGAQHLLCVSEEGFPESVIEQAELRGPSVRLLTLRNLEKEGLPLSSALFNTGLDVIEYIKINGLSAEGQHVMKVKEAGKTLPEPRDAVFRVPETGKVLSTEDVADWFLFRNPKKIEQIPADSEPKLVDIFQKWEWDQGLQFQDVGEKWVPLINLRIQLLLARHKSKIEWNMAEYFQLDWGDGIAWAMKGEGEHNGKKVVVIIPIKKLENARYAMGHPFVIGDFDAFIAVNNVSYKAMHYDNLL